MEVTICKKFQYDVTEGINMKKTVKVVEGAPAKPRTGTDIQEMRSASEKGDAALPSLNPSIARKLFFVSRLTEGLGLV